MDDQNLYIVVDNGEPVSFPISEHNLKVFLPDLDPSSPPDGLARVIRTPMPEIDGKRVIEDVHYELNNYYTKLNNTNTYMEVYQLRDITFQEKMDMIQQWKRLNPLYIDWIYDEESENLIPPIPQPEGEENHVWVFPDESKGETEGRWVPRKDVYPTFNEEEFPEIIETIKELGLTNDITDESIQEMLDSLNNKPPTE